MGHLKRLKLSLIDRQSPLLTGLLAIWIDALDDDGRRFKPCLVAFERGTAGAALNMEVVDDGFHFAAMHSFQIFTIIASSCAVVGRFIPVSRMHFLRCD